MNGLRDRKPAVHGWARRTPSAQQESALPVDAEQPGNGNAEPWQNFAAVEIIVLVQFSDDALSADDRDRAGSDERDPREPRPGANAGIHPLACRVRIIGRRDDLDREFRRKRAEAVGNAGLREAPAGTNVTSRIRTLSGFLAMM